MPHAVLENIFFIKCNISTMHEHFSPVLLCVKYVKPMQNSAEVFFTTGLH